MTTEAHRPDQSAVLPVSQQSSQANQVLDRAAVLHIVRTGAECPPVSDTEIAQAAQRKGLEGTLLATIAIDHMLAASTPDKQPAEGTGFSAYLRYAVVSTKLEGVTGQQQIAIDRSKRAELQKRYGAEQIEARKHAAGFINLIGVVSDFGADFNTAREAARGDPDWLRDLASRAEATDNPLLEALPSAASYGRRYPARREAVAQAGRLLLYIVAAANV